MTHIEHRTLDRKGRCRVCNKDIDKNEQLVTVFEAQMSRYPTIILCDSCVDILYRNIEQGQFNGSDSIDTLHQVNRLYWRAMTIEQREKLSALLIEINKKTTEINKLFNFEKECL